jgi:iron-sulfur cluster assembly accessory protein
VKVPDGEDDYFDRLPETVISAVENGKIPRAQYGAILIDEGHDFKPEWLKLITQMLDPASNALLMLYDDAQGIYKAGANRNFSLKSVGIQAQGRTTILRINYRNTDEVLNVAYHFAKDIITPEDADDDGIPLVLPESAGRHGIPPALVLTQSVDAEVALIAKTLHRRHEGGTSWSDMAVLYRSKYMGQKITATLAQAGVPHHWLNKDLKSRFYDPTQDTVKIMTFHASKGLEFDTVIVAGIGTLPMELEDSAAEAREFAKQRIREIREEQSLPSDSAVRISVRSGGCSGLTYDLDFDTDPVVREQDEKFEDNGIRIVVDMRSFLYLAGTQLDYTDGLSGQGFHFRNPNAVRTCSCGIRTRAVRRRSSR